MEKVIYLSGPITGLPIEEVRAAFTKAENKIRERYGATVEIVNPLKLETKGATWEEAMRTCIEAMMKCNYIHMLPGFEKSKGARLELTIAENLQFGVCNDIYELVRYGE